MLVEKKQNGILLALSDQDALMLLACARESFAAIGEKEYQIRIGYQMKEVSKMAAELRLLLESIGLRS